MADTDALLYLPGQDTVKLRAALEIALLPPAGAPPSRRRSLPAGKRPDRLAELILDFMERVPQSR